VTEGSRSIVQRALNFQRGNAIRVHMYAPQANAGSGLEELRETENPNRSISAGSPAKAAMIKTLLLTPSFRSLARDIGKNFLAFFRFTEADACTLLSPYGLHALEENRLQNNRSNEPYQSPKDSPTVPSREQQVVEKAQEKICQGRSAAGRVGRTYLLKASKRNPQLGSQARCCSAPIL
jgi:hypothetical protein